VVITLRPLYPRGSKFRVSLSKRIGGFHYRVVRFGEEKNVVFSENRNPDRPARSLVTVPTELSAYS